jgi:hypothetical protein
MGEPHAREHRSQAATLGAGELDEFKAIQAQRLSNRSVDAAMARLSTSMGASPFAAGFMATV